MLELSAAWCLCGRYLSNRLKLAGIRGVLYSQLHSSIIVRKISTPPVAVRNASLPFDATLTSRGPWATGYVARDPWITGERAATFKRGMDKRSQALPPRTAYNRALPPAVGRS